MFSGVLMPYIHCRLFATIICDMSTCILFVTFAIEVVRIYLGVNGKWDLNNGSKRLKVAQKRLNGVNVFPLCFHAIVSRSCFVVGKRTMYIIILTWPGITLMLTE